MRINLSISKFDQIEKRKENERKKDQYRKVRKRIKQVYVLLLLKLYENYQKFSVEIFIFFIFRQLLLFLSFKYTRDSFFKNGV